MLSGQCLVIVGFNMFGYSWGITLKNQTQPSSGVLNIGKLPRNSVSGVQIWLSSMSHVFIVEIY